MEHIIKKVLSLALLAPLSLLAHGENLEVISGNVSHEIVGKTQTITADDKSVIHFSKFNLSPDEQTKFVQPHHKSSVLCRVTGKEASKIRGRLEANGRLLLINPYGIIFGETAQVNVGTLIASTLNIKDEDFLSDNYKFFMEPHAQGKAIVNKGQIEASEHVVFMASQIFNQGIISARAGKVELLGGEAITLSFDSDDLISFVIEQPLKEGVIEQAGKIVAQEVFIKLKTAQQLIKKVVNVDGLVEASQITRENGIVRLVPSSSIEAPDVEIAGRSIESNGDLKAPGSLQMDAQDELRWLKWNVVGDLSLTGDTIIVTAPIDCGELRLNGTSSFQIGSSIHAKNSNIIFNAPVTLTANDITFGSKDMGGDITFEKSLNVDPKLKNVRLNLDAITGDINFSGPVGDLHPLEAVTIVSAHNVFVGPISVGTLVQKSGTATTVLGGFVNAPKGVDLNADVIHVKANVSCEKGDFIATVGRNLDIFDNAYVSAQSFQQKGSGSVALNENIMTSVGGISFAGPVNVSASVDLIAAGGKAPVHFNSKLSGPGNLSINSSTATFMGDIGVDSPLSTLRVSCSGPITVHNIGNGKAGVNELVEFTTQNSIHFRGSVYHAGPQIYTAVKNYDFLSGKPTQFITSQSIAFSGGPLFLSPGTDLNLASSGGSITLPQVKASNCNLSVSSKKGTVVIGKVEGVDHLTLESKAKIGLGGNIDAHDTLFVGPVSIETPDEAFSILAREGNIHFRSSCKGNVKLQLAAPKGKIILDGQLGGPVRGKEPKFKSINLNGKTIDQNDSVNSTGFISYQADRIYLGGDVNCSNNDITFNGPVTLDHTNAIAITNGFSGGNIIFLSTLDADRPSRALVIENGKAKGAVFFKGDIGVNGPLGDLKVSTSKLEIMNVGGKNAGVAKHLDINAESSIDCYGTIYNAGQQTWAKVATNLKGDAPTTFITNGLPMVFSRVNLEANTSVTFDTKGGILELSKLFGQHHQSITINTGHGQAQLGEIGGTLDNLHVQGREIVLNGKIDVGSVFMEATHHIHYNVPQDGSTFNKTSIISRGDITLNAKHGMIGSNDYPVRIEAGGLLYVGAESFAYLEGTCSDGFPHNYDPNPAPLTVFNRNPYQYIFFQEYAEEDQLMSLAPDLSHKIPGEFIDGSTLKPRRAAIFYEATK